MFKFVLAVLIGLALLGLFALFDRALDRLFWDIDD